MNNPAGRQVSDAVQRFYFSELALRGALVQLDNSYVESLNGRDYTPRVQKLVGEALAASVLMGSNFKHAARLTLQARGSGPLSLLVAEASCEQGTTGDAPAIQQVRALARFDQEHPRAARLAAADASLGELLEDAQLAITLESIGGDTTERYQGIVALDAPTLAGCLEHYFARSEQLPTVMVLGAGAQRSFGLMVQKIPDSASADGLHRVSGSAWEEIAVLARSVREEELLDLEPQAILHRLFHEHQCRLAARQPVQFACTCSAERTGQALLQVGDREIEAILEEDGEIVMDCEFCSTRYRFDRAAIENLRSQERGTRH